MRQILKTVVKNGLHAAGFAIVRAAHKPSETSHKFAPDDVDKDRWLKNLDIKTVLDVGANTGQFAQDIHSTLPDARIYSFEPLKDCYKHLSNAMLHVPNFRAFNFALGDQDGEVEINRSSFSPSSSILTMEDVTKEAFPFTDDSWERESVHIRRLDDVAKDIDLVDNVLIKIDVQGFEDRVIRGGQNTIRKAKVLIVEMSFESLYDGQPLFDSIYQAIRKHGFTYHGSAGQLLNPIDGRALQADGIFLRH